MNKWEYKQWLDEYQRKYGVSSIKLLREYVNFLIRENVDLTHASKYYDKFFRGYGDLSCSTRHNYMVVLNKFTRYLYWCERKGAPPHRLVRITGEPIHYILTPK